MIPRVSQFAVGEGFAVENILATVPVGTQCFYYRTGAGAEIEYEFEDEDD